MAQELKCSYNTVSKLEREGRLPKNAAVRENLKRLAERAGIEVPA